jgi:hypothetical protein
MWDQKKRTTKNPNLIYWKHYFLLKPPLIDSVSHSSWHRRGRLEEEELIHVEVGGGDGECLGEAAAREETIGYWEFLRRANVLVRHDYLKLVAL